MRKIYVVGPGGSHYSNWMESKITTDITQADLVCFTGGEDVSPALYDKLPHPTTRPNPSRDAYEAVMFQRAKSLNKKMIGICRGSQFLCVMNGGTLVQHQENPSYYHFIELFDRDPLVITSTHHQAQFPFDLPKENYKVLGWTNGLSDYHYGESFKDELSPEKECEIVHYPKGNALGIQGHPESMDEDSETIAYLRGLLNKFMENKL